MTDREKRLVTHALSLEGVLETHHCEAECRATLLDLQSILIEAWGQDTQSLANGEGHELMDAVNDAIMRTRGMNN
jgi:hypothetical protein